MTVGMTLLEVEDLHIRFGPVEPVSGFSCRVGRGETLGIVGESGSGKSVTALAILGLLRLQGGRVTAGRIRFENRDLIDLPEAELRRIRGRRIALITQNPMTALAPVHRVGEQLAETARLHLRLGHAAARRRALDLLAAVRIPDPARAYARYPHQLSGGLRQRVVIAMALVADPALILADEPTTALDVTVQAQILALLQAKAHERGLGLVLITHDISVVAQLCDRVVVMYAGHVVESGAAATLLTDPKHPYTQALIGCVPRAAMARGSLAAIPGTVPAAGQYPPGCRFHPRCPHAMPICALEAPAPRRGDAGEMVACYLYPEPAR